MADDTPRMWIDDEPKYDPETGEIIEETSEQTDLAIVEEIPLPTIEEQNDIIKQSSLSEEGKSLLGSLVEMNNIANTLTTTYSEITICDFSNNIAVGDKDNFLSFCAGEGTAVNRQIHICTQIHTGIDFTDDDFPAVNRN